MKSFLFTLAFVLIAVPSWATITCTGQSFSYDTPSNPQAQSYTVPSVTNGITFFFASARNNNRTFTSGPTAGGAAATAQVLSRLNDGSNTTGALYYWMNLAAGATTFTGTYDSLPLSLDYTMVTCSPVNQVTPTSNPNSATGSSATVTVDCTSSASQLVVDFAGANGNTALGSGAGQTFISQASPAADGTLVSGSSYETGAATTTMSHSITSSTWHTYCLSLNELITSIRPYNNVMLP